MNWTHSCKGSSMCLIGRGNWTPKRISSLTLIFAWCSNWITFQRQGSTPSGAFLNAIPATHRWNDWLFPIGCRAVSYDHVGTAFKYEYAKVIKRSLGEIASISTWEVCQHNHWVLQEITDHSLFSAKNGVADSRSKISDPFERHLCLYEKEGGTKFLASPIILEIVKQDLAVVSGLYYADFIGFYSLLSCAEVGRQSNSNGLWFLHPLFFVIFPKRE